MIVYEGRHTQTCVTPPPHPCDSMEKGGGVVANGAVAFKKFSDW